MKPTRIDRIPGYLLANEKLAVQAKELARGDGLADPLLETIGWCRQLLGELEAMKPDEPDEGDEDPDEDPDEGDDIEDDDTPDDPFPPDSDGNSGDSDSADTGGS